MYSGIVQWQLNLGPKGLVGEFLATVVVITLLTWLLFKKNSSVFWKQTDYAYLFFTILGSAAAVADLAISNWTKEIQQIQITVDERFSRLNNYVDGWAPECERSSRSRSQQREDLKNGVIKPSPPAGNYLWVVPHELPEPVCTFILAMRSAIFEGKSFGNVIERSIELGADPVLVLSIDKEIVMPILSEIAEINMSSNRLEELKKNIASLSYFSILKNLSPFLLGLGVGVRLARTHFDVKAEQKKQRQDATADIPSPAVATTNDGGFASSESAVNPTIDALKDGASQSEGPVRAAQPPS